VVDDPHSSLVSGETTVAEAFPRFESDVHSSLHGTATSMLDPIDELLEADDLGADALGPETLTSDELENDDLGRDSIIVENGDVTVISADDPILAVSGVGNVTSIGWIAPTDADLLLEEEESDPVIALAFADRPSVDSETATETIVRPEDTEGLEDHVRMYLREIGLVPLLSWDGEKRLARRMEEGVYLERLAREVQQADSETTALEVMAELERRFVAHFGLLVHWFSALEMTVPGFRTAMTTLGDTADISIDRCHELGAQLGCLGESVREDLIELSTLCRLMPDEVRDWVAARRADGDMGPLCPIVGRALTVDPRALAEHLGWVQFEAERSRASLTEANLRLVVTWRRSTSAGACRCWI